MTWVGYACIAAALAGLTFVLVKAGMKKTEADLAVAVFTSAMLIFASVSFGITGVWKTFLDSTWLTRSHFFLLLSSLAYGASLICIFRAMKTGEAQKVTPYYQSHTVVAMIAAVFILKDTMDVFEIIGVILILAGTASMVMLAYKRCKTRVWIGYAAASVVLAVISIILERKFVSEIADSQIQFVHIFVTFFLSWILVLVTGGHKKMRSMPFLDGVFICLAAVAIGMAVYWYHNALAIGPNQYVQPIYRLSLIWTVVFSCLFLHEQFSARESFGLLLIIAGTLILYLL